MPKFTGPSVIAAPTERRGLSDHKGPGTRSARACDAGAKTGGLRVRHVRALDQDCAALGSISRAMQRATVEFPRA